MVGAIRLVSVERGHDPRAVRAGRRSAAPARCTARTSPALLGMRTVVVPRHPGVLSTFGLLASEVRNDYARTSLQKPPDHDRAAVARRLRRARGRRPRRGSPPRACRRRGAGVERLADLRYRHQGFEITVPWPERDGSATALIGRFHDRHQRLYTLRAARRAGRDRHPAGRRDGARAPLRPAVAPPPRASAGAGARGAPARVLPGARLGELPVRGPRRARARRGAARPGDRRAARLDRGRPARPARAPTASATWSCAWAPAEEGALDAPRATRSAARSSRARCARPRPRWRR